MGTSIDTRETFAARSPPEARTRPPRAVAARPWARFGLAAAALVTVGVAGCATVLGVDVDGYDVRASGGAGAVGVGATGQGGAGRGGGGSTTSHGGSAQGGAAGHGGSVGGHGGAVTGSGGATGGAGGGVGGSGGSGGAAPLAHPSCAGGLDSGGGSCCDAAPVPGGTFPMGRGTSTDACPAGLTCLSSELPEHVATVAAFALDTFEITVGRFRRFVEQYDGTPPVAGSGAHPQIANSGWKAFWDASLPIDKGALIKALKCSGLRQTWTDGDADGHESYPLNCLGWFEAFAFCAWDGGRLPTEAEWEYAAAGGSADRLYPWGATDPSVKKSLANDAYDGSSPFLAVGAHPAGDGVWGHRDLAGGVREWNLDGYDDAWYAGAGSPCDACANLAQESIRTIRGGYWFSGAVQLRSVARGGFAPGSRSDGIGARCARSAP